jgi:hypothetical protein
LQLSSNFSPNESCAHTLPVAITHLVIVNTP